MATNPARFGVRTSLVIICSIPLSVFVVGALLVLSSNAKFDCVPSDTGSHVCETHIEVKGMAGLPIEAVSGLVGTAIPAFIGAIANVIATKRNSSTNVSPSTPPQA